METYNKLETGSIKKAVRSLDSAIRVFYNFSYANDEEKAVIRAGVIQHFKFTYELCWKFIKRWIEMNINPEAADGVTRRELFRLGAENKLIDNVDKWMEFHKARNSTSHMYDEDIAEEVLRVALESLPYMKDFASRALIDAGNEQIY
jgi:nucleotidyltransferase substrate binding protein (TIGR01987 family)